MKYKKGQRLLLAATYEVEVVLEEDCEENDLYGLPTAALLNTGDMDAHLNVISVLGVNLPSDDNGEDPELLQDVSRETGSDEESQDWKDSKRAVNL